MSTQPLARIAYRPGDPDPAAQLRATTLYRYVNDDTGLEHVWALTDIHVYQDLSAAAKLQRIAPLRGNGRAQPQDRLALQLTVDGWRVNRAAGQDPAVVAAFEPALTDLALVSHSLHTTAESLGPNGSGKPPTWVRRVRLAADVFTLRDRAARTVALKLLDEGWAGTFTELLPVLTAATSAAPTSSQEPS